jgi:small subunit ribosomal protein S8
MPVNDPIADFLTRLRNAAMVGKSEVTVPFTRILGEMATLLAREGFVESADTRGRGTQKELVIKLRYINGNPAIESLRRVSTPGRRIYRQAKNIRAVRSGYGMSIVSTPRGLMTNKDAKKENVGGEILCEIW